MLILRRVKIRDHERGLLYRDRDFKRLLEPGKHWITGLPWKVRVQHVSERQSHYQHGELEVMVAKGALTGCA